MDLAEEFPLLASLVERRPGGQKRLPIGQFTSTEHGQGFLAASVMSDTDAVENGLTPPETTQDPDKCPQPAEATQGEANSQAESSPGVAIVPGPRGRSQPSHYGLSIRFESHDGDPELGRLVESTIVVNDAHPAYRRAVASRSEGYHITLAVALALARLAVPPAEEHEFVTAFLTHWGEALDGTRRRSRKRS
jgi:hypothetical protein